MADMAWGGLTTKSRKKPGGLMALFGVLLILLAPIADIGLGLLGVANDALDESRLETAGAVIGAVLFAFGLDLLALGLIRRSRRT